MVSNITFSLTVWLPVSHNFNKKKVANIMSHKFRLKDCFFDFKWKKKNLKILEIQSIVLILSTSFHCLYLLLVREMPQLLVLFFVNGFLTIDVLQCSLRLLCYTKHALTLQSNLYYFSTVQFGDSWMPITLAAIGSGGLTKLTGSWQKYLKTVSQNHWQVFKNILQLQKRRDHPQSGRY